MEHGLADGLHIVEQGQEQEYGAYPTDYSVHFLDGGEQHLRHVRLESAAHGLGNLQSQAVAIDAGAEALADAVADEAAHGEGHGP